MKPTTPILLTLALLACSACAIDDDDDFEFRNNPMGGGTSQGTVFNTNYLEEVPFSQLVQYEPGYMGITVKSITLADDRPIDRFEVEDSGIALVDKEDNEFRGEALLGSEWSLHTNNWLSTWTISIANISYTKGRTYYQFTHFEKGGWVNTCREGGSLARVLRGFTLDESSGALSPAQDTGFIACLNGAVGKAAMWGYYDLELLATQPLPPQDGILKQGPLVPEEALEVPIDRLARFELAIRVVRADYCYDGKSYTEPGVPLLVEDTWGVRPPSEVNADATIEAVWGAEGLLCAYKPRTGGELPEDCSAGVPLCTPGSTLADYPGGLIMTRLPMAAK